MAAPSSFFEKNKEIHLWQIQLNKNLPTLFFSCLDESEQQRARQFKNEYLYHRYVVAHAATRDILAKYLNISANQIRFIKNPNQKPAIDKNQNAINLDFNLSHSHEIGILAVSQDFTVGIDIEHIRPLPNALEITKRFFSPEEYKLLFESPEHKRPSLFFKLWTAKEAFLKANGLAISGHLNQFGILFGDKEEPSGIQSNYFETKQWALYPFRIKKEYQGILAAKGDALKKPIYFNWN